MNTDLMHPTPGSVIGELIARRPHGEGARNTQTVRLGERIGVGYGIDALPFVDRQGCGLFVELPFDLGTKGLRVERSEVPQAGAFLLGPGEQLTLRVTGQAERRIEFVAAALVRAAAGGPCALCRASILGTGRLLTGAGPLRQRVVCPACAEAVEGARG